MRVSRSEQQERNRRALVVSARRMLAAAGPSVTLEAIADDAGLTTGAVYSIFGSKQKLFAAAVEDQFAGQIDIVREVSATDLDLPGVLVAYARRFQALASAAGPVACRTELSEMLLLVEDDDFRLHCRELKRQELQRLTRMLTGRVIPHTRPRRRTTAEQAGQLAAALRAVLSGFAVQAYLDGGTRDCEVAEKACAALARMVG
ncbi:TetR/AcrR family transcriptional regulator [Amycolatopsis suaedae]|nr:TetR/AcrR family transcriptional regulator [Amycolatopsis suaedae]